MMTSSYEAVIGLEVHVQLRTASKAFCGCSARFGDEPNTNICPVCLGYPGALPVLNRSAVESAVRLGLALGARISTVSHFDRKHYFYADLPKGYQITQFEHPICEGGLVEFEREDGTGSSVGLRRIHMEEDAGKSIHDSVRAGGTRVDMNRAGVPLLEIVTDPTLRSGRDAALVLRKLRQVVTYLGISDGIMEEGSLRCDANVSLRRGGTSDFGTKTELKNMNSFRNVERAIEFEIARQARLLGEEKRAVEPETLLWDADRAAARPMRGKEGSGDYRYLPEPDLSPVLAGAAWVDELARSLPELPGARRDRFRRDLGLPLCDADVLTAERATADYFEEVLARMGGDPVKRAKQAGNWVRTEILRLAAERKTSAGGVPVRPDRLAGLLRLVEVGAISGTAAKEVFAAMAATGDPPEAIVAGRGLTQLSDEGEISLVIDRVLARLAAQEARYRAGRASLFGFFVGEVMKATGGRADPGLVNALLKKKLD